MVTESQSKNVYQRRMDAKKILAKERFMESNSESQYKTVSIGEILSKVRLAHAKANVLLQSGEFESLETTEVASSLGKPLILYKAVVPYEWINPDNPEDRCEVKVNASVLGMSADDKWTSKLYTSSLKVLLKIEYDISGVNAEIDDIDMLGDLDAQVSKPSRNAGEESKSLLDAVTQIAASRVSEIVTKSETPKMKVVIKPKVGIEEVKTEEKMEEKKLKINKIKKD